MFRAVAMAVLTLGVVSTSGVAAADPSAEESAPPDTPQARAEQRARETLVGQLKVSADEIEVKSVEPRTWSDSSMGCRQPGTMALQVITHGYAVVLRARQQDYNVHVSGDAAVVCDSAVQRYKDPRRGLRARGLNEARELARKDLAQRLNIDPKEIRFANIRPQNWPDSSLGCPQSNEEIVQAPVAGFRMTLMFSKQAYTYHATETQTRPCPAIEVD